MQVGGAGGAVGGGNGTGERGVRRGAHGRGHCSRVSGPKIFGEARTSPTVTGAVNTAYGLPAACLPPERAALHLLEPERQHAVGGAG